MYSPKIILVLSFEFINLLRIYTWRRRRTATFALGPIVIGWDPFLGEIINFVIIAFVVFMIAKKLLKEEKVAKK